jgi:hypothetical protein
MLPILHFYKVNKRGCQRSDHATSMSNFQSISTFLDSTVSSIACTASSFTRTTNFWLLICRISDTIEKNLMIILLSYDSLPPIVNKPLANMCVAAVWSAICIKSFAARSQYIQTPYEYIRPAFQYFERRANIFKRRTNIFERRSNISSAVRIY